MTPLHYALVISTSTNGSQLTGIQASFKSMGVPPTNIFTLAGSQATRQNMLNYLSAPSSILRSIPLDARVYIYLHGSTVIRPNSTNWDAPLWSTHYLAADNESVSDVEFVAAIRSLVRLTSRYYVVFLDVPNASDFCDEPYYYDMEYLRRTSSMQVDSACLPHVSERGALMACRVVYVDPYQGGNAWAETPVSIGAAQYSAFAYAFIRFFTGPAWVQFKRDSVDNAAFQDSILQTINALYPNGWLCSWSDFIRRVASIMSETRIGKPHVRLLMTNPHVNDVDRFHRPPFPNLGYASRIQALLTRMERWVRMLALVTMGNEI